MDLGLEKMIIGRAEVLLCFLVASHSSASGNTDELIQNTMKAEMTEEEWMAERWAEAVEDMEKHENEIERVNNRIFRAIKKQLGEGFYNDLKIIIEEDECHGACSIVKTPAGKFQQESDFGCIVGVWIVQHSSGDSGDSFYATVTIKLKNYLFLEMPFAC